jgi:hypothetical protein
MATRPAGSARSGDSTTAPSGRTTTSAGGRVALRLLRATALLAFALFAFAPSHATPSVDGAARLRMPLHSSLHRVAAGLPLLSQ